ncbi:MAG: hypothetical protein FWC22_06380 [Treponema sp.]|nr:hypothetical protein [Treponema sp.]MCL2265632.1 hypothetical protein [Treponema sp.]MCL2265651.1 hypothetical protein [Treponema sp.]
MKKAAGLLLIVMVFIVSVPAFGSERDEFFSMEGKKFWSLGLNLGTSFATPLLIVNLCATIAPLPYSFFELGVEFGSINGMAGENVNIRDVEYSSNYFYARFNIFAPFGNRVFDSYGKAREGGGWYIGLGLGIMNAEYAFIQSVTERTVATVKTPTFDGATGFYIGRGHILFKAGYAIRTTMDLKNLIGVNHRLLLGVCYRIY